MNNGIQSVNREGRIPEGPGSKEREHFHAMERGRSLLHELETILANLRHRFPRTSFVLQDRFGVQVRAVGDVDTERCREHGNCIPLMLNGREFGNLYYIGEVKKLTESDTISLILRLTELEHWGQTEGERRGEKVHKLLSEGMTSEVTRLLSLCGLTEHARYTIVAMELTSPTNKFLFMDQLREFMMAHIWQYKSVLEFVAYRPCGLLGIFPGVDEDYFLTQLNLWMDRWQKYKTALDFDKDLDLRACLISVEGIEGLDNGVRKVEATLKFAARWNLSGLIRPQVSYTLAYMLSSLSEEKIFELVHRTLGPLLTSEHEDLLHTLRAYLFLDQNAVATAKSLYIHRNTLLYRIRHIEELLGIKLRNTAELSTVWSALEGLELLESSNHD